MGVSTNKRGLISLMSSSLATLKNTLRYLVEPASRSPWGTSGQTLFFTPSGISLADMRPPLDEESLTVADL